MLSNLNSILYFLLIMNPLKVLDYREVRRLIVEEIVDYRNKDIKLNSSFDRESESYDASSKHNLSENTEQIMEEQEQSEALIDMLKVIE